jgi:hypothetical protein
MSEISEITDALIDALADAGDRTTQMEKESGVTFEPLRPVQMTRRELTKRLIAKCGGMAEFLTAMGELYVQASRLDAFIRERIGETDDWPVQMIGDIPHIAAFEGLHCEMHELLSALHPGSAES